MTGLDNILQAINMRMNTLSGSMVKQTTFGLINATGLPGTEYAYNYAAINFRDSLMQDPRIESVTNVVVTIDGDAIYISADVTPVGIDTVIPISASL
jgi:hypothetical protein